MARINARLRRAEEAVEDDHGYDPADYPISLVEQMWGIMDTKVRGRERMRLHREYVVASTAVSEAIDRAMAEEEAALGSKNLSGG